MLAPFQQCSRRIIQRLGQPVTMICDDQGKEKHHQIKGVFVHPEQTVMSKGKQGQLLIKAEVPRLTVMSDVCPQLSAHLRIIVNGQEYYPIPNQSFNDGVGCMVIALAAAVPKKEMEEENDGSKWR